MNKKSIAIILISFIFLASGFTQEFGFGSFDSDLSLNEEGSNDFSLANTNSYGAFAQEKISSNFKPIASVEALTFNFFDTSKTQDSGLSAGGRLGFDYYASSVDGRLAFDFGLYPDYEAKLDEAWIHSFYGPFDVKAGLLRHTWGKADSSGPLDVINPKQLDNLSITDADAQKISQTALILGWSITPFTRLELAATPWFEANSLAMDGDWAAAQVKELTGMMEMLAGSGLVGGIGVGAGVESGSGADAYAAFLPNTTNFKYVQAGARLTGTFASQDFGLQYWYGNMRTPRVALSAEFAALPMPPIPTSVFPLISYDRYHLVGVDWASVLVGLNLRAELAALLTEDLSGDDPSVANPQLLWSFGFDRDLFAGISLFMQADGLVRLMYDKISTDPLVPATMAAMVPQLAPLAQIPADFESQQNQTETRIMARLSRSFLRDELECNLTGLWGLEDGDFYLLPEVKLLKGDLSTSLGAGFFFGNKDGTLGQFYKNNWLRLSLKYDLY